MKLRLRLAWLVTLFAGALSAGCVERRFIITTDPPGAIIFDERGDPTGAAPADRQFVYYGDYQFTLVRDGYETMTVRERVRPPWYEWFLVDFFTENLIPWTFRDIRRFNYQLQPKQIIPPDMVLQSANTLRQRGQSIGIPLPQQPTGPGPVASSLMPAAP